MATFLKDEGIQFRLKRPPLKAVYAECMFYHLKRKLFMAMRELNDPHWEKILPSIVKSMNSTPHLSLGNLRPIDLTSREKAAEIDVATNYKHLVKYQDIFFHDKDIQDKLKIKVGDYVYKVTKLLFFTFNFQ